MDIVDLTKKALQKVRNPRQQATGAITPPASPVYEYIELRDVIRDSVARNLKHIVSRKKKTSDCTLVIYMPNQGMYDCCKENSLHDYIRNYLHLMTGNEVKECRLVCSEPPATDVCTSLEQGMSMALHLPETKDEQVYAGTYNLEIRTLPGTGSLVNGPVLLHPIDGNTYNIGAGQISCINRRIVRRNHIVIDDNPESPMYPMNKYVSRAHAHIIYKKDKGYILYADERGTHEAGKGIFLSRDNDSTEISLHCPEVLKDGDCILLSGKVILYVEFKNSNQS